jgi:hypothetical protein
VGTITPESRAEFYVPMGMLILMDDIAKKVDPDLAEVLFRLRSNRVKHEKWNAVGQTDLTFREALAMSGLLSYFAGSFCEDDEPIPDMMRSIAADFIHQLGKAVTGGTWID